ncbi:MAG TPA: hypothetical protein PLR51_05535 [Methanomassiliicoccales archaeon]|nr:hypothetical protein [Methanomassiliicoccales archaeon]
MVEAMLTYITIMFSSDERRPSEIFDALHNMGFQPTTGNYDGVFKWDKKATLDDAIYLADRVHLTLKGTGAIFKLETVAEANDKC